MDKGSSKRKYTREFREAAVKLVTTQKVSVAKAAADLRQDDRVPQLAPPRRVCDTASRRGDRPTPGGASSASVLQRDGTLALQ